jgi:hypothetical protein
MSLPTPDWDSSLSPLDTPRSTSPDRSSLLREVRGHLSAHLYDESPTGSGGVAIYSLSDPRDIRLIQYVGQTAAPRRRFVQHLSAARLWLPDERPWWVRSPRLRPLYAWIRELYRDGRRLPVMVVSEWVERAQARAAEHARIQECLRRQQTLLNFEGELSRRRRRPAAPDA